MQRRAVPCGSVLGPGHWPKMVETNDVAGASFGGTSKTFAGLARLGLVWPGLVSRAELLNRIKISWCIFTDCSSARRVRAERERKGKRVLRLGATGLAQSLRAVWAPVRSIGCCQQHFMLIFISAIDALPICMESEFESGAKTKNCANCPYSQSRRAPRTTRDQFST